MKIIAAIVPFSFPLFSFTIITLLTSPLITVLPTSSSPKSLVIKLIHPDSVYTPKNVTKNLAESVMKSSIARFSYFWKTIGSPSAPDDFQASILPANNISFFFMNISIGQPPVPQFLVMDTGSSLLWLQCLPCANCLNSRQLGPIFNPAESSTYSFFLCDSKYCSYAPRGKCNLFNQCEYNQTYASGFTSVGTLSTEQITFKTSDEGLIAVQDVVFGCSHDNGNFKDSQLSGVFGLGFGKISFLAQFGSKFSYCIGNTFDRYYSHNKLILGEGAKVEGESTPLEVINGHYQVALEGISVGDNRLQIDPDVFKRKMWGKGGVIIDTGAPATWLVKEAFEALRNEVQNLLDVWLTRYYEYDSWALCYRGMISQDLIGFPVVTFHFAGGADLVLETESLFLQGWPYAFCMAVLPSNESGFSDASLSLIGIMAQQNYNVAYDIEGKRLSFQRIDCELLDD